MGFGPQSSPSSVTDSDLSTLSGLITTAQTTANTAIAGLGFLYTLGFNEGTTSPAVVVTPVSNAIVTKVAVQINTAAGALGATIQVGHAGVSGATTDRYLATNDVNLMIIGTYTVDCFTSVDNKGGDIILTITPGGQTFQGTVFVWTMPAV
jgi:hypothetical protein